MYRRGVAYCRNGQWRQYRDKSNAVGGSNAIGGAAKLQDSSQGRPWSGKYWYRASGKGLRLRWCGASPGASPQVLQVGDTPKAR